MEVRTTQDGLLRAFGLLMGQQRTVKQKRTYSSIGNTIHAARCLRKDEAAAVDAIVGKLNAIDPNDKDNKEAIEALFKELGKHPIRFVPRKREQRIDFSKTYPYRSTKRGG
jgi:nucleoside-diphosphate-sugar epimerase